MEKIKLLFLIFITTFILFSCSEENNYNPCEDNPCKDSLLAHKTVCKPLEDDFTCVCEEGYEEKNGNCIKTIPSLCSPNPCTEENKNICKEVQDSYQCFCNENFYDDNGVCKQEEQCKEDSCTQEHKTVCNIVNHKITCSCDDGFVEDENSNCVEKELSSGCFLPRYEAIFENHLKGIELIRKLHQITKENYHCLGYDTAKTELYYNIDSINGKNRCVYTGRWHNEGSGVNCEHTWPQSQFGREEPMKSDLHHLFTTEPRVNSSRGHLRFANIAEHVDEYSDYDEYGNCDEESEDYYCSKRLLNGGDDGIFEPADQHKGNVARAIFYFAVRYGNMSGTINEVYAPFINEDMKQTLVKWNKLDPVDEQERTRNDKIEGWIFDKNGNKTFSKLQGNRNPFIDCPELLDMMDLNNNEFPESYNENEECY